MIQKVEIYYEALIATRAMQKHIDDGWRVHTCTMTCVPQGYSSTEKIIVVYEK